MHLEPGKAYYAGGFRRIIDGVPCKVFSKQTPTGVKRAKPVKETA